MQRRDVRAAGLRVRAAEREVDGAGHLLVEQDRAGRAVDARRWCRSRARRGSARRRRSRARRRGSPRRARRWPLTTFAVLERRARRPRPRTPSRARGDREADRAVGRVLERAGEHLAARHVAPAVGVDPGAAVDAQAQVGAVRLDPDLARRAQPLDQLRLAVGQLAPGGDRVRTVEEQRARRRTPRSRRRSSRASWASAGVGHSVPHQRLPQPRLAGSARARGRHARSRAGSIPGQRRACSAGASIRR